MLVLSRRTKETIRFPELDITIEILQIKGSNVRVGIDAPIEISILRGELEDCEQVSSLNSNSRSNSRSDREVCIELKNDRKTRDQRSLSRLAK